MKKDISKSPDRDVSDREQPSPMPFVTKPSGDFAFKPIETWFNNVKFRSRLEARWAVFFTELNIKWEYEFEGYDLNGIWYLPDFWLPEYDGGVFVEVKPITFSKLEFKKIYLLCSLSNKIVFMAVGSPDIKLYEILIPLPFSNDIYYSNFFLNHKYDCRHRFWIETDSESIYTKKDASDELIKAVRTAKSYRF